MPTWNQIKFKFRNALIDASSTTSLSHLLNFRCDKRIERVTSPKNPLDIQVDEILNHAVDHGWLETLASGVIEQHATDELLVAIAQEIVASVLKEGKGWYQRKSTELPFADIKPYLNWLQLQCNNLPLGPLDPSGRDNALINLDDVYIALNTNTEGKSQLSTGKKAGYQSVIGHLHNNDQLILLGDPGSGKSTILRFVAFCLCNAILEPEKRWPAYLQWTVSESNERTRDKATETQHWQHESVVPIFIQLRDFAKQASSAGLDIWRYLERTLPPELALTLPALHEMALQNRVLFMFDGVDEVAPSERVNLWATIGNLTKSALCGGNRWVTTCRVLSFVEDELPRRHLPVMTLQPLDGAQIDHFIDNWYSALAREGEFSLQEAAAKTSALQSAVRGKLQELAQNPMLLTIMAIVQTYEGALPDERALLYQRCVETLLLRWQRAKDDENSPTILQQLQVSQRQLEQLLWHLGWEAHRQSKSQARAADLPESDVIRIAKKQLGSYGKAEQFLLYTEKKAHLLIGYGGADELRYSFPHRTFQEYLAACYLESERRPLRKIGELAAEGDPWREVINLAFGRLMHVKNDRIKAIDILLDKLYSAEKPTTTADWRRVWLTAEAAATIGPSALAEDEEGRDLLPKIRSQLVALLEDGALTTQQRAEAGDALAVLGDPRPGVISLEPDLIEIPDGEFYFGNNKDVRTIDSAYQIARYPVTVAQYTKFVEGGGYDDPKFWGGEDSKSWHWLLSNHDEKWRGKGKIKFPEYWLNPKWHVANRPIVGVSWYEATAYCNWLSEQAGRRYRLPTEFEWERAARHTDGRKYTWGENWEDGIVNSREAKINRTTTVGAFPKGRSECGADEMSGNVGEWTSSYYDNDKDSYCVRGGSWGSLRNYALVAYRYWSFPASSSGYVGFRVLSPVF